MGKSENIGYQHFLLFSQHFLPIPKQIEVFELHLLCAIFGQDQNFIVWQRVTVEKGGNVLYVYM